MHGSKATARSTTAVDPRGTGLPSPGTRLTDREQWLEVVSCAGLTTRHGTFQCMVFRTSDATDEHLLLSAGPLDPESVMPVRIQSECMTSEVFGSLSCDCREQLDKAMHLFGAAKRGLIIYLRQEGRGIGLGNKIAAYALQQEGLDTVEANERLGFPDDLRTYQAAALVLRLLHVQRVNLLTNNPSKIEGLRAGGIEVVERTPLMIAPTPYTQLYLQTKLRKSGHLLNP
jgi:GTP cyclohydrolase II